MLCFNVTLAAHLREALTGYANIYVHHFDGWARSNQITRKRATGTDPIESDEALGVRLHERLQEGKGDARRFAAVLIDEAQDFDRKWFECVLEAMREPNDGDLIIVGDRQQGLYGPRDFTWSSIGVNARGRTIHSAFDLDTNYRNSREIVELASIFTRPREESADDKFGVVPVDPTKCPRTTGIPPMVAKCENREHECRTAFSIVSDLLHVRDNEDCRFPTALAPSEIGILYPWMPETDQHMLTDFIEQLSTIAPVIRLHGDDRHRAGETGIKIQTIHASKGLQYRAVILLWADRLPGNFSNSDPAEEERRMYVALTRPEDYLFVLHSRPSQFIDRIWASGKAVAY